jgi:hypothetical protein
MKKSDLSERYPHQLEKLIEVASWVAYAKSEDEAQFLVMNELRPLLETINHSEQ